MNVKLPATAHHAYPVGGLIFGFIGSAILGGLIGLVYLATVAPTAIRTTDEQHTSIAFASLAHFDNEVRYYQSSGFRQNAQALARKLYASETNQIEITSLELNAWAIANLSPRTTLQVSRDEGSAPLLSLEPEIPVFQIAEQQLHISYPSTLKAGGFSLPLMLITSGDFAVGDSGPEWQMRRLYLNSAPIPLKLWVYRFVKPRAMRALAKNAEVEKLQTTWKRLKSIRVGATTLQVERS